MKMELNFSPNWSKNTEFKFIQVERNVMHVIHEGNQRVSLELNEFRRNSGFVFNESDDSLVPQTRFFEFQKPTL